MTLLDQVNTSPKSKVSGVKVISTSWGIPPISSMRITSSNVPIILPPISSNKPTPIRLREFVASSTAVLIFTP